MAKAERARILRFEGEAFLRQAYLFALDRQPDPVGMRAYADQLAAGLPKEAILSELEASAEGRRVALRRGRTMVSPPSLPASTVTSGMLQVSGSSEPSGSGKEEFRVSSVADLLQLADDGTFLRAAYMHLLRREADPSGLENYRRQLAGGCSREQVVLELATSPEGHQADASLPGLADLVRRQLAVVAMPEVNHVNDLLPLRPEVFVRAAYQTVLGREVDPEGLALYTDLLAQGWSRSYILNELVNSEEGRSVQLSLRGLKPLVKRYRKAQSRSLRGWYHRAVKGAESDLPQDRLLRAALLAGR